MSEPMKPFKACAKNCKDTDGRSSVCNGRAGHTGDCSPNHDCCGDRYPCYVTARNCKFCGFNDGRCTHCLEQHELTCAEETITRLKARVAELEYEQMGREA